MAEPHAKRPKTHAFSLAEKLWYLDKKAVAVVALVVSTVGPLIIESFWGNNRVSTGALGALDDPLVVQTKI